jgi:hypothetical protein
MTDYKATPEQWAQCEDWVRSSVVGASDACILELRARIEQLEANTKHWRTDHLRLANTCASLAPDRRAFFNALLPDDEDSQPTPNPSQIRSSLVDRVALAISGIEYGLERDEEAVNWASEARAAIREVAVWMTSNPDVYFPPALVFALEQEADR